MHRKLSKFFDADKQRRPHGLMNEILWRMNDIHRNIMLMYAKCI